MEWLVQIFGEGKELGILQMSCRAIVVFTGALAMLRITGQRTFGNKTAFDQVVMIMLGAILSRGVTGSSPFLPVLAASFVIVLLHRVLGWLSLYSDAIGNLVKGTEMPLYKEGRFFRRNMKRSMVSEKDLMESIRLQINENGFENAQALTMERSGTISVVSKGKK